MKIEIIFAVVLGTIIGLAGMFGVVMLTTHRSPLSTTTPNTQATATPRPTTGRTPDGTSWDDNAYIVEGEAPQSPFVIATSESANALIATSNGHYDGKVAAKIGYSNYTVFTSDGRELQKKRVLALSGLPQNLPVFVGSITDLTQDGLQLRAEDGTIEQIKFLPNILTVNLIKELKKTAITDLAIGDRVVVAGGRAEKEIITAQAVAVLPATDTVLTKQVTSGKIDTYDSKSVKITKSDGSTAAFTISSTLKLHGLKSDYTTRELTRLITKHKGAQAYVVSVASSGTSLAQTLYISE